jgi:anti-anti-sigma factor
MELTVKEIEKDINMIYLRGELDMYNSVELKEYINTLEDKPRHAFIVDCGNLSYIDSSGVSTLIYFYSTLQKQRIGLWFVNIQGAVRKVIELTKLEGFLPIAETVDEVLEVIRKKRRYPLAEAGQGILVNEHHDLFNKVGMIPAEFPSDFKRIRYFTNLIVQRAPAEIRDINILEQQISEIIKNAVKHGNRSNPGKKIKVWFSFSKYHAHLVVQDEGTGFQEIEKWNEFYRERRRCFEEHDFDRMENFLTFRSAISDENDGGNAMFAAVEYWNCGVVYNEARNCIAVRRDFSGIP